MVETSLLLDVLILVVLFLMIARSHWKSEEVHHRLDDVIDGVGMFATEVLKRTETLTEMGSRLAPSIELHNHDPFERLFSMIRAFKTGDFGSFAGDNITNPRDSAGQYATTREEQIEDYTSPEIIDIDN